MLVGKALGILYITYVPYVAPAEMEWSSREYGATAQGLIYLTLSSISTLAFDI